MKYHFEDSGFASCMGVKTPGGEPKFHCQMNPHRGWDGNSLGAFRLPFNYQPIWSCG